MKKLVWLMVFVTVSAGANLASAEEVGLSGQQPYLPKIVFLAPGVPQTGAVEPGPKTLSSTQYAIEVLEGTRALLVRLKNEGSGNIDLYIRFGQPVEIVDGQVVADFSSTSPMGFESTAISGSQLQAGTYYMAVENLESSPQNFSILIATLPVIVPMTPGEVSGRVEAARPGERLLTLTQYIIDVPEGIKKLSITLTNLGIGDLNLHVRYGKPVEEALGKIVADFSSTSLMGIESIVISGAKLLPGKYYIAIENLEPYSQDFKLMVTLTP